MAVEVRKIGKYELVQRVGVGGMGEVWKARDPELGRWVAIKVLKNLDGDDLARFRREARTAAALSHPNIAAVYEAADSHIVMQFIDGANLDAGSRDAREAVDLVRQAALAVHHAHVHGIIHRDLKPANIMVSDGRAYVTDFGLAKLLDVQSSLSHTGLVVGTPLFMSPEQARGEVAGVASDVYGLGATLYAVLAGRPPFAGETPYEIIRHVVEDEPAPLRADPDLGTVVHKCLDKDPARRYATALELAQDLERWLAGEAVLAREPSLLYRLSRGVRRRPAIPAAAALLALLVVGSLVAGTVRKGNAIHRRIQQASMRESERRLGEARDEYRGILEMDPGHAGARAGLDRMDERLREVNRSMESARSGLDAASRYLYHPDFRRSELLRLVSSARAHLDHAQVLQQPTAEMIYLEARSLELAGEDVEAEARLRGALALDPGFAPAHLLLGRLLLQGAFASSLLIFVGRATPSDVEADGLLEEAAREIEAGCPDGDLQRDVVRSLLDYIRKRYVELRESLKDSIARYEGREGVEEFHWIRGLVLRQEEKAQAFDQALRIRPKYVLALISRAAARLRAGDHEGAAADFSEVLTLKPNLAFAHLARADSRINLSDWDGALSDAEAVLEIEPENLSALCLRARARAGRGEWDAALRDLDRILERTDECHLLALELRGIVRGRKKDHAGVILDCSRFLEILPNNVAALGRRALAWRGLKRFDEALADLDLAIQLSPGNAQLYMNRSSLRCEMRDYRRALADADVTISLAIDQPEPYLCRAAVHVAERRTDDALKDYETALRFAPKDWPPRAEIEAWVRNARRP